MDERVVDVASDCWRWFRATLIPFAAFSGMLVLVTLAAYRSNKPAAALAALALLGTSLILSHLTRRERASQDYAVGRARAIVTALELLLGIELAAWAWKGGPDAAGFLGLGIAVVSLGGLVSELRRTSWLEGRRGPIVLGVALGLIAVALVVLPADGLLRLVAIGVLLAMLGAELYSEDYLHRPHTWRRVALSALGAVFLVGSIGSLVVVGMGWGAGLAVMAVVLAVVWMVSSDSDSLLLVALLTFALLWAGAPRPASDHPERAAVASEPYFLVLGDSYISGEGAKQYEPGTNTTRSSSAFTNGCRRAPTAWPNLMAADGIPGVPSRVLFLACSGAETRHIRTDPPRDGSGHQDGPAELVELQARRAEAGLGAPAFVVLSLGGNDAGFGTIGQSCVGPGDCSEVGDQLLASLQSVEPRLDAAYADIRDAVGPDVPVVVTGYPIPLVADGPCSNVLLTAKERHFLVAFVHELNEVVQSAATRAGFDYLDTMEGALVAGANPLCGATNPVGINFIGFNPKGGSIFDTLNPANWIHNSLHPNEAGHRAMRDAAEKWFAAHPNLHVSPPSGAPRRTVPGMASLFPFGFTRLCTQTHDTACGVEDGTWAADQTQLQLQTVLLPLVLAMVGAWMVAIGPIGWATERSLDVASILVPAWRRERLAKRRGPKRP